MTLHAPLTPTPAAPTRPFFGFKAGFPPNRSRSGPAGFDLYRHSRRVAARFPGRRTASGLSTTVSAVLEANKDTAVVDLKAPAVRIVAFVGEGSVSPLKSAPWLEVMLHTVL